MTDCRPATASNSSPVFLTCHITLTAVTERDLCCIYRRGGAVQSARPLWKRLPAGRLRPPNMAFSRNARIVRVVGRRREARSHSQQGRTARPTRPLPARSVEVTRHVIYVSCRLSASRRHQRLQQALRRSTVKVKDCSVYAFRYIRIYNYTCTCTFTICAFALINNLERDGLQTRAAAATVSCFQTNNPKPLPRHHQTPYHSVTSTDERFYPPVRSLPEPDSLVRPDPFRYTRPSAHNHTTPAAVRAARPVHRFSPARPIGGSGGHTGALNTARQLASCAIWPA